MKLVPTFYEIDTVLPMLDLTLDGITELSKNKTLLVFKLATGELCFPEFQFRDNDFYGELISVFQQFPSAWDAWEITCWFYAENTYLGIAPIGLIGTPTWSKKLKLVIDLETSLALLSS